MKRRNSQRHLFAAAACAAMALAAADAGAQGPPTAFEGFSKNRDQPVKIQAASLEVRDKDKIATFRGDVQVTQGDTLMRCQSLVVYYDAESGKGAKPAQPGPMGQQQIRRMEATGGVVVNQKDQNATGERADFDMRSNTLVLSGNVVVTKGQDVLRGQKLVVNLTDGVSRMEGGRVDALINSTGGGRGNGPLSRPARPK